MAAKIECEQVAELLPWFQNGTLEGPEHQFVRAHLAHCGECLRELAETTFARSVYEQHVPADVLVNLAYDLPIVAAQHDLFDRHLSACSECTDQLDMVRASRRLQSEEEEEARPVVVPLVSRGAVSWQRSPVWQYGAIAATLLFVIAAGGWLRSWQQSRLPDVASSAQEKALTERLQTLQAENDRLRQAEAQLSQQQTKSSNEIEQLRSQISEAQKRIQQQQEQTRNELAKVMRTGKERMSPQINVLALDIYPVGMVQRDAAPLSNEIAISGNAQAVTLMLHSQASSESTSYRIEILNARGKAVWKANGLLRNPTNDFTISVAAESLTPGRYTINIYGKSAGRLVKVESYEINVKRL